MRAPFLLALCLGAQAATNSWDVETVFAVGSKVPDKNELAKCVDAAAGIIGIDLNMKADSKVMMSILKEDMLLDDMPAVNGLLAADLKGGQPLRPMLEKVREGISSLHPALGVVLCNALRDKLIVPGSPDIIKRSIHHMYLLDKLTAKMAEDVTFMEAIHDFLYAKTQAMVVSPTRIGRAFSLFQAAGLFGVAKDYSVNKGMGEFIVLRKKGTVAPEDAEERAHNLAVNIAEATATDALHLNVNNVKLGYFLAKNKSTGIQLVGGDKKLIRYGLSMDWARLYETWNFAFITANLDFPNLLYPKLLAPRVLLADGGDYIYERAVALWLSINFYLIANLKAKEHVVLPHKAEIGALWAKVNRRYVDYIAAQNTV